MFKEEYGIDAVVDLVIAQVNYRPDNGNYSKLELDILKDTDWKKQLIQTMHEIIKDEEINLYPSEKVIGKCSAHMGNRVWAHMSPKVSDDEPYPALGEWIENLKLSDEVESKDVVLFTIAFQKDHWFMAPALEEFLIKEFNPKLNSIGKWGKKA